MKLDEVLNEEKNYIRLRYDDNTYTCAGKRLTSLEGCPSIIDTSDFDCRNNLLTSLKGCPDRVKSFDCRNNLLTSLEDGPSEVAGYYWCTNNKKLTSLKGSQEIIEGAFDCCECDLKSLKGAPKIVKGTFACSDNKIDSLEGCPSEVSSLIINKNNLTSLKDIHKIIKKMDQGSIWADKNPITSHVLGVLLIDGCVDLQFDNKKAANIVNKYLPNTEGMAGVLKCQEELFAADLDDYAQL